MLIFLYINLVQFEKCTSYFETRQNMILKPLERYSKYWALNWFFFSSLQINLKYQRLSTLCWVFFNVVPFVGVFFWPPSLVYNLGYDDFYAMLPDGIACYFARWHCFPCCQMALQCYDVYVSTLLPINDVNIFTPLWANHLKQILKSTLISCLKTERDKERNSS